MLTQKVDTSKGFIQGIHPRDSMSSALNSLPRADSVNKKLAACLIEDWEMADKLYSRVDGSAYIKHETGFDISPSTMDRDCTLGQGPTPTAKIGMKYLYRGEELIRYAYSRLKPIEATRKAGPGRPKGSKNKKRAAPEAERDVA
jgi:hypothetical protein